MLYIIMRVDVYCMNIERVVILVARYVILLIYRIFGYFSSVLKISKSDFSIIMHGGEEVGGYSL